MVGIRERDSTRRTFAAVVSSNYFTTLGVQLAAGRQFTAGRGAARRGNTGGDCLRMPLAAIRRRSRICRQHLTVNATPVTIVGIAPRGFTGTMAIASPDLWFPLGVYDQMVTDIFKPQAIAH